MRNVLFTRVVSFLPPAEMGPLMRASWSTVAETIARTMHLRFRVTACPACETVAWYEARGQEPRICPRCAGPRLWTDSGMITVPRNVARGRPGWILAIQLVQAMLNTMSEPDAEILERSVWYASDPMATIRQDRRT